MKDRRKSQESKGLYRLRFEKTCLAVSGILPTHQSRNSVPCVSESFFWWGPEFHSKRNRMHGCQQGNLHLFSSEENVADQVQKVKLNEFKYTTLSISTGISLSLGSKEIFSLRSLNSG